MAENSVDVHILTTPFTRVDWLQQALQSLREEPANVHLLRGAWGDLGASRKEGFSRGQAPYVTFVDHDDLVVPGAIAKCVQVLDRHPGVAGAFTDQTLIDAEGNALQEGWSTWPELYDGVEALQLVKHPAAPGYVHHLLVFRREVLAKIDFTGKPRIVEPYIIKAVCDTGELLHLPIQGYKWRIHSSNTFPTFTTEEVRRVIDEIAQGV